MQQLLTIKEASTFLNIKEKTLYSLAAKKEIPHYRIGKIIRFNQSELDTWLQSKKVTPVKKEKTVIDKKIVDDIIRQVYNPLPKGKPVAVAGKGANSAL